MKHQYTNALIHSTSPYLLQHAHNPVNWQPWSEEIVKQAQQQNKLILISIGYAACHWCHVMEHESFEDTTVARVMNDHFICVKVDREERPDVDSFYMTAVQVMQQQGGWPLNVIALPDGRPIWGGTYFTKEMWLKNLQAVAVYYHDNKTKTKNYASDLQGAVKKMLQATNSDESTPVTDNLLKNAVEGWKSRFDKTNGGRKGNPKFPMPVTLDFLQYFAFMNDDNLVSTHVENTLLKMAQGGIYDQVGGGFARYSVDEVWKVPHFEKMLYDNGQLLSIYSKGFSQFKNPEFKRVVYETADFFERELMDKSGAFYSSLDADSDGEEGKYYVWNKTRLQQILESDFELFAEYFNINSKGFWENGNYILLRNQSAESFAREHQTNTDAFLKKVSRWKKRLLTEREKRVRPGLDDKTLTSWNALVILGLVEAYKTFADERFLKLALKNANFIKQNQVKNDGSCFHTWKNGKSSVSGFLEDYALVIQAWISLFEVTADENWLKDARNLNQYVDQHFWDEENGLYFYSAKSTESVLLNHYQNDDNVIPASNSVMANNLHKLYLILGEPAYLNRINRMIHHITPQFENYPMAYSNWGIVMLKLAQPFYEVAITGENSAKMVNGFFPKYQPNVLVVYSTKKSDVPILKDRFENNQNLIYVCERGVCQLPVKTLNEAWNLITK